MTQAPIAVVAAMPEELAPLRQRATALRRLGAGALRIDVGRLDGRAVALAVTGDGDRNARAGVAALLAAFKLDGLIGVGLAGALSPGLGAGELVVAGRVVREGGGAIDADAPLVAAAVRACGGRSAVAVTADHIADTVAGKQRLLGLARADDLPAVVDLESAAYAEAATAARIPWLILRAVSDEATEALPALLNRARDAGGAVRRGRVLMGLVSEPAALPRLWGLRRRLQSCATVLASGVGAVMGRAHFPSC